MGWTIGIPSLKLNNVGTKSKHCGNFRSVAEEALLERKGHDPDINPELSSKNKYVGYQSAADLMSYSDRHCSTLTDASGRTLRKDSVRMCVTILKPPAAYMETLSEEDQDQFLQDGIDKVADIVGTRNIKSIAWHYDEQGTHVHIFWEPITKDGRLCAKEMHNLTFLGRLNREIPIHLREKGWDIDDCNAYDAAAEALKTEKDKSERRQKNGRSSTAYKASAERELHAIQYAANILRSDFEQNIQEYVQSSIELVTSNPDNIYEDALFLLQECDDNRFEELSREGSALKKKVIKESLASTNTSAWLDDLIADANTRSTKLSWQEREDMWDNYRCLSSEFWELRNELKGDYSTALDNAYRKKRNAVKSFYDAKYFLYRTRGIIPSLIALIWALVALNQQSKFEEQIREIRDEQDQLIRNTASFKKYSNAYIDELKAGKMPFEGYLSSIANLVESLDKKERQFRKSAHDRHNSTWQR